MTYQTKNGQVHRWTVKILLIEAEFCPFFATAYCSPKVRHLKKRKLSMGEIMAPETRFFDAYSKFGKIMALI